MSLADSIRAHAEEQDLPSGGRGDVIGISSVAAIAVQYGVKGYEVEAKALSLSIHPARYLRNQQIIDIQQQTRLLKSTVSQVGLGGLGGTLLETLLRTGIGTIRGADGDIFEASNLNRQALSSPAALNRPKADIAAERAEYLNPSVSFEARNEFLNADTLPDFLEGSDLAIDALGGLETRPALQHAAAEAGIPLVTGALAGWTGYVSVVLPGNEGPADIMGTNNGAEEKLGCPAPAVNFFAALMAAETVKMLATGQSELTRSMLIVDMKALSFDRILL